MFFLSYFLRFSSALSSLSFDRVCVFCRLLVVVLHGFGLLVAMLMVDGIAEGVIDYC